MLSSASFAAHHALVGRSVRVQLRRDHTFVTGVLYGVDPESGDLALLQLAPTGVKIVLGHAIESVELDAALHDTTLASIQAELSSDADLTTSKQTATHAPPEEREALATQLRSFLDERFIPHAPSPVDPTAVVVFGGAATLRFPFDPRHGVDCTNEQILLKLQSLLTAFPG